MFDFARPDLKVYALPLIAFAGNAALATLRTPTNP